jgi:hypothetical protein
MKTGSVYRNATKSLISSVNLSETPATFGVCTSGVAMSL